MDERSIQITAFIVMKLHGDNASEMVIQCIEEAAEQGSDSGVLMSSRVFDAIEEWDRLEPVGLPI